MLLSIVPCGPVAANMMFVGRDGAKTVAVIDPSDAPLALAILKERGWTLSDILITHRRNDLYLRKGCGRAEKQPRKPFHDAAHYAAAGRAGRAAA